MESCYSCIKLSEFVRKINLGAASGGGAAALCVPSGSATGTDYSSFPLILYAIAISFEEILKNVSYDFKGYFKVNQV